MKCVEKFLLQLFLKSIKKTYTRKPIIKKGPKLLHIPKYLIIESR